MEGRLGAWTPLSLSKGVVVLAGMPSGVSGREGIESAGELNPRVAAGLSGAGVFERAVLDALPQAVVVTSPNGEVVLWNRAAEVLYGWNEEEVIGCRVVDVLVPLLDREVAQQVMATVLAGETWSGDFPVVRRDGDIIRAFVVDTPVLGDDGSVIAVVGASEDVTTQRLTEQRVGDLAQHLALALDAGELGTWRWDMVTGETVWDEKLEALYGLEPGGFPGTFEAYVSLLHPEDALSVRETVARAVREKSRYTVEHRVVWPDGSVHWVQGRGQVTLDANGDATGTMGCSADITEQKHAAERLDARWTRHTTRRKRHARAPNGSPFLST